MDTEVTDGTVSWLKMNLKRLTDDDLWTRIPILAATERTTMAVLIEHLAELDERRICVGRGFPSLYEYCVHALKFSEGEAYRRIRAVRAVRKRPELLTCLQDGSLTLNSLVLLHPHLDLPHGDEALRRAKGLGTGALERVLAEYVTAPAERDTIRFVGMDAAKPAAPMPLTFENTTAIPAGNACEAGAPPPAAAQPARRKLVRFKFMADEELFKLVRHAQALLRHKYPDGRLEGVFRDALTVLLAERDPIFRNTPAAQTRGKK